MTIKLDSCDNTLFVANLTQRFRFVLAKGLFRDLSAWQTRIASLRTAVIILLANGTLSAMLNEFANQKGL